MFILQTSSFLGHRASAVGWPPATCLWPLCASQFPSWNRMQVPLLTSREGVNLTQEQDRALLSLPSSLWPPGPADVLSPFLEGDQYWRQTCFWILFADFFCSLFDFFFVCKQNPQRQKPRGLPLYTGTWWCPSARRVQQSDGSRGIKDSVSHLCLRDMSIYLFIYLLFISLLIWLFI